MEEPLLSWVSWVASADASPWLYLRLLAFPHELIEDRGSSVLYADEKIHPT